MQKLLNSIVVLSAAGLVGCGQYITIHDETIFDNETQYNQPVSYTENELNAYKEGAADVLADMRGKMQGQQAFVFAKPIVNCGVKIPARVINGTLVPSHEACVQIAPAQFKEQQAIQLPTLGDE